MPREENQEIVTNTLIRMPITLSRIASNVRIIIRQNSIRVFTFIYLTSQRATAQEINNSTSEDFDVTSSMIINIWFFLVIGVYFCCISCPCPILERIRIRPQEEEPIVNEDGEMNRMFI
jgi:hypothetical protein